MSQAKAKKPQTKENSRQIESRRSPLRIAAIVVGSAAVAAAAAFIWSDQLLGPIPPTTARQATVSPATTEDRKPDFQRLVGEWVRPDGGYVISIGRISPDGHVDMQYLNPRPINVSKAELTASGKSLKLFVELRDAGYPGSTYELVYKPGDDVLAGSYFQAALGQRFDVVFLRNR